MEMKNGGVCCVYHIGQVPFAFVRKQPNPSLCDFGVNFHGAKWNCVFVQRQLRARATRAPFTVFVDEWMMDAC